MFEPGQKVRCSLLYSNFRTEMVRVEEGKRKLLYQKSIRGSISAFGVQYSHSLALGSNSSCGNLVNSSFFFVKSRYLDDT